MHGAHCAWVRCGAGDWSSRAGPLAVRSRSTLALTLTLSCLPPSRSTPLQDLLRDMDTLMRSLPPTAQVSWAAPQCRQPKGARRGGASPAAAPPAATLARSLERSVVTSLPVLASLDPAQVASQEGKFLAKLFSSSNLAPYPAPTADPAADIALPTWVPLPEGAAPFEYRHAGSFA